MFNLELAWDRPARAGQRPSQHCLRVRIVPQPATNATLPLHLALAIDTSGSMEGAKLARAKEACKVILARLRPQDRLSLCGFDTEVHPLLDGQGSQEHRASAETAIQALKADGVTRMDLALKWIDQVLISKSGTTRHAILITDGQPTDHKGESLSDTSSLLSQGKALGEKGITLSATGFGDAEDFNASFLMALGDAGRGAFHFAPRPEGLSPLLEKQLVASQAVAATNARLSISILRPGVILKGWCRSRPDFGVMDNNHSGKSTFQFSQIALQADSPTDFLLSFEVPPLPIGEDSGTKDVIAVELNGIGQTQKKTAALTWTLSFSESQRYLKEVDDDRRMWDVRGWATELQRPNDPKKTIILLQQIADAAAAAGRPDVAAQAQGTLDAMRASGYVSPNDSGILGAQARSAFGYYTPGNSALTMDHAKLRVISSINLGKVFSLDHHRLLLGRSDPDNRIRVDIDLEDCFSAKVSVSRRHAELSWVDGHLRIIDLNSTNGTYVNGKKLPQSEHQVLVAGDRISIGEVILEVTNHAS